MLTNDVVSFERQGPVVHTQVEAISAAHNLLSVSMDGCDLTSFFTVLQSYQDDRWVIMKGSVQ